MGVAGVADVVAVALILAVREIRDPRRGDGETPDHRQLDHRHADEESHHSGGLHLVGMLILIYLLAGAHGRAMGLIEEDRLQSPFLAPYHALYHHHPHCHDRDRPHAGSAMEGFLDPGLGHDLGLCRGEENVGDPQPGRSHKAAVGEAAAGVEVKVGEEVEDVGGLYLGMSLLPSEGATLRLALHMLEITRPGPHR